MKPINYVKKYHGKVSFDELMKLSGYSFSKLRGVTSSLVKKGELESLHKGKKLTKKQKANKNLFNNVDGIGKIGARTIMVKYLRKLGGLVPTLPSHTCKIEQMLVEDSMNYYKFIGCEGNREVYVEMVKKAMQLNLNMSFHFGLLGEIIQKATKDEFAHIVMDYCGTLHKAQGDIRTALTNDIVQVGGTLLITMSKRSAMIGGIVDEMHNINPNIPSGHTKTSNALMTFIKVHGGLRYKIAETHSYKDTASMILVVVERVQ